MAKANWPQYEHFMTGHGSNGQLLVPSSWPFRRFVGHGSILAAVDWWPRLARCTPNHGKIEIGIENRSLHVKIWFLRWDPAFSLALALALA